MVVVGGVDGPFLTEAPVCTYFSLAVLKHFTGRLYVFDASTILRLSKTSPPLNLELPRNDRGAVGVSVFSGGANVH